MSYSPVLSNMVRNYMNQHGIKFDFDEANGFFTTDFVADDEETVLDFAIAVLDDSLVSYTLLTQGIPARAMGKVAEYLHRANYGLVFGNFELDYDTGTVQYKCFLPAPEGTFDPALIQDLFAAPVAVVNRYMGGLAELRENPQSNPWELIKRAEGTA